MAEGIFSRTERMSPERAAALLAGKATNRTLKVEMIRRLQRDILAGHWMITHQGIAINPAGQLIDGQNRLTAIVQTGRTVDIVVSYNVADEVILGIDCGVKRTHKDVGIILGVDPRSVSIAAFLHTGYFQRPPLTKSEQIDFIREHQRAIDFSLGIWPGRSLFLHVAIAAAITSRAWYRHDPERLAKFARVCVTGRASAEPGDSAPLLLRNWYTVGRRTRTGGGYGWQREVYGKTSNALKYFLADQAVYQLRALDYEFFTMADEPARV